MKYSTLVTTILFCMAVSVSASAEQQTTSPAPLETAVSDTEVSVAATPGPSRMTVGKGMLHGGRQGKCQSSGKHGKDGHDDHREVTQRLDMIEARLAKIEAMLEILVRR